LSDFCHGDSFQEVLPEQNSKPEKKPKNYFMDCRCGISRALQGPEKDGGMQD